MAWVRIFAWGSGRVILRGLPQRRTGSPGSGRSRRVRRGGSFPFARREGFWGGFFQAVRRVGACSQSCGGSVRGHGTSLSPRLEPGGVDPRGRAKPGSFSLGGFPTSRDACPRPSGYARGQGAGGHFFGEGPLVFEPRRGFLPVLQLRGVGWREPLQALRFPLGLLLGGLGRRRFPVRDREHGEHRLRLFSSLS